MQPTMARTADLRDWLVAHDPLPISALIDPTWLSMLGPSCVLAARRLVAWLEAEPAGFEISLVALAGTLGLGAGTGRHAPVVRTLTRLVDFQIATVGET